MNYIDKLQKMIDESNNIVFFGGAGVSTESGIKDFRGKDGLYTTSSEENPEYLLSIGCLVRQPEKFYKYYRENMNYTNVMPNITHKYLKKLEDMGKLRTVVTQNIDGLHQKAGSKNVLEVHGTTARCYCMKCGKKFSPYYIFECKGIPKCECGGMVRPDVTLYGEMLPVDFDKAIKYITQADLLIVGGTSLTVYPASSLITYFRGKHLVIINKTETPYDRIAELVIHESLGKIFSKLK